MKKLTIAAVVLLFTSGCTTVTLDSIHAENDRVLEDAQNFKTMCIFENTPNAEYDTIKKFKVGKGSYGPVSSVMPRYVAYADRLGGNTITNYRGGQRFGFWPWRIVRPVAAGTAVKWKEKTDVKCKTLGGRVYAIQSDERVWDITDQIKNKVN